MTSILYLDFDLQIERAEQGYRAQIVASPTGQASETFTLPFSDAELEKFLVLAGRPRSPVRSSAAPDVAAAEVFGGHLFETLFHHQIRDGLQGSLNEAERQGKGLRIRLRFNDTPELADIPWEYLYRADADRFLALSANTPLVRYLELPGLIHPLIVTPPLRILVVLASPSDFPPLDMEAEWNRLHTALHDAEARGLVTLDRLDHATIATLQIKLRQDAYHIFHFIGHGGFDAQTQDGMLMLEDQQGNGSRTRARDLGVLLQDYRTLRLALLNACEGGRSGRRNLFDGVAQTLVRQGIPAVIAMQFPVTDQSAIVLANTFYSAVADGYPVDAALAQARQQIFTAGDNLEWGTPVLYLRTPDGQIFDLKTTPPPPLAQSALVIAAPSVATALPRPPPGTQQWPWRSYRSIGLIIILLLGGAAAWLGRPWLSPNLRPASAPDPVSPTPFATPIPDGTATEGAVKVVVIGETTLQADQTVAATTAAFTATVALQAPTQPPTSTTTAIGNLSNRGGVSSITFDESVEGEIIIKGGRKYYDFKGESEMLVNILAEYPEGKYLQLFLIDPKGKEIASCSIYHPCEISNARLPEAGTYRIIVDGIGVDTPNYTLTLARLGDEVSSITFDESVEGEIIIKGERKYYDFKGESEMLVNILAEYPEGKYLQLFLIDPKGKEIASCSIYHPCEISNARLPEAGTYRIIVDGIGVDTPNYTLTLTKY